MYDMMLVVCVMRGAIMMVLVLLKCFFFLFNLFLFSYVKTFYSILSNEKVHALFFISFLFSFFNDFMKRLQQQQQQPWTSWLNKCAFGMYTVV